LTLSALIFCYVLALISILLIIEWIEKRKNKFLFFSLFFAFLSIFTRETMYVLPGIIYLLLIYKQKSYFTYFKKNLLIVLPFLIIVLIHLFLRKIFVAEASHFDFSLGSIKFGDEEISVGNFIKIFKSSWLPMGYWSINKIYIIQTVTFFSWVVSLLVGLIISIKYISFKYKNINFTVFFLIIFLLCLPSVAVGRSFGIMLPTLITISFISILLSNLLKIKTFYNNKIFLKIICNITIIFIILSGICGGYFRSNEHISAMNVYSAKIVYMDSILIYQHKNIKMSKIEYDKKIVHLESLNIFNWDDAKNIHKNSNVNVPKFGPLEF
jgi:hypothetical protein